MNERIKELMIEAFQSHYGDPVTPVSREKAVELVSGWGEKFAQLIAEDCAKMLDEDSYIMPELGGYAHDIRTRYGAK
jgi:hypothetical protein